MIIVLKDKNNIVLKFYPDSNSGNHKGNPYTDADLWEFEKFEKDFPTNYSANTLTIKNYIFKIDITKIIY